MVVKKRTKVVYLAYTRGVEHVAKQLIRVYAKSSYQKAYNWLADIADRYHTKVVPSSDPDVTAQVMNGNQIWWLECHNVE